MIILTIFDQLDKNQLKEILVKCWMTHDGAWFYNCYNELGIEKPHPHNPYFVSLKKQGIDLIKDDRVIKLHQLHQIGLVNNPHPSYNLVRGELDLKEGFRHL